MQIKRRPRARGDEYLDPQKFRPDTPQAAKALGIVCGAPRMAFRVNSRTGKPYLLEVVGPEIMLRELNRLWGTGYIPNPYSGDFLKIGVASQRVLETLSKLGFRPGCNEETLNLSAIKDNLPKNLRADFDEGYKLGLSFRAEMERRIEPKSRRPISKTKRKAVRSLRPKHLQPETPAKAFAFGFLATVPNVRAVTDFTEIDLIGPKQWLTKLMRVWQTQYQIRHLRKGPFGYGIRIRSKPTHTYLTKDLKLGELDSTRARITHLRSMVPDKLQTEFDKGVRVGQELLTKITASTNQPDGAAAVAISSGKIKGRLLLERVEPNSPGAALAWGILSTLQVKLDRQGQPLHFLIKIRSASQNILTLLQQLWQIEPPYRISKLRKGPGYHFTASSRATLEYLEAAGLASEESASPEELRSLVPEAQRVFFDAGVNLARSLREPQR